MVQRSLATPLQQSTGERMPEEIQPSEPDHARSKQHKKAGHSVVPQSHLNINNNLNNAINNVGNNDAKTPMTGKHIYFHKTMDTQQHLQTVNLYHQRVTSQKSSNISKT